MGEKESVEQSIRELTSLSRDQRSGFWVAVLLDAAKLIKDQYMELEELRYLMGEVEQGDKIRDKEIADLKERLGEK